ncbi:MAG: hypothetical protein P4L92_13275 [Rudaea sp.]|nr:hypothetical protein [Rudaea sp.]
MPWLCTFRLRALLPCLLTLLTAACNAPPAASSAPDVAGAHPLPADVTSISALAEEGRGESYEFHIRYPDLPPEWSALIQALHAYAAQRKQEFLDALPAPAERTASTPPAALDLEFDIARRTEDFVSVLARETMHSSTDTAPRIASFVMRTTDGKILSIVDLFATPDAALQALSDESRRQLEGRYEASLRQSAGDGNAPAPSLKRMQEGVQRGTQASVGNFSVFFIDGIDSKAIGLTLIFPQAQLAATSGGEQQVEVPAKVFYHLLKPEYRDAFAIDTAELKPGVR